MLWSVFDLGSSWVCIHDDPAHHFMSFLYTLTILKIILMLLFMVLFSPTTMFIEMIYDGSI